MGAAPEARAGGGRGPTGRRQGERAVAAILELAVKEERCFKALTHLALNPDGPNEEELLGMARDVFAALRHRGRRVRPEGFSEHVWRALREVLPNAPGVRWDEAWADGLARRALVYVAERVPAYPDTGDSDGPERAHDEVVAAAEAEDRRRYRRALRVWVAATRPGDV